ncbi:YbhB/YbcL family Raf kinase inhibitor-like protein [Lentisalinibacter orientalis]|uniref:YbhB/YbcL family Raf kinase inhibitor-like protein n=1 Tax=Lentisalinibacter orientalis TaxID=2992241 RepID=UPI0038706F6C
MNLTTTAFRDGERIPDEFCFGNPADEGHMTLGANRNPDFTWANLPEGTRSLVLLCVDVDVPSKADDVNQEGRTIPADLPRVDFYHWVMVDIPPGTDGIPAGSCSDSVTPKGKKEPAGPDGARQGLNDYTSFMAGNPDMAGEYFGYDGPCPPWNDELLHHYHFVLYATDLERVPVEGKFTGQDVMAALAGHILAESRVVGTYTLNPDVG